jgi:hypothetical protein
MATIKPLEGRTVCMSLSRRNGWFIRLIESPLGPSDSIRTGHRGLVLGGQRAGRKQSGCLRDLHWYVPRSRKPARAWSSK